MRDFTLNFQIAKQNKYNFGDRLGGLFYLPGNSRRKDIIMQQYTENKINNRKPDKHKCAGCKYKGTGFLCYNEREDMLEPPDFRVL